MTYKKMWGQVQKTVNFYRKRHLPKEDILEYTIYTKEEIREYTIHKFNKKMLAMPGWDTWDISIHMASGQYERMERATNRDISVMSYDPKYKLAKIQGKTSIYLTSCFRCSCPDYRKRRLPCKHMYALSERLGGNVEQSILDSEHAPLYGLTFALVGHLPRSRNGIGGIRAEIKDRGGICSNNIDFNSSAVVMGKNPSVVKVEQAANFDMEKLSLECIMEIFT